MATVLAEKREKPEGFRFDAESQGTIDNVTSFVHNKHLSVWNVRLYEDSKTSTRVRPADSTPAATAERIACEFEVCKKSLPTALKELQKEYNTLSNQRKMGEAKFFKDVIKELQEIQKKGLPVWLAHQEFLTKNVVWSHPHKVAERLMNYCECVDARNKTKISVQETLDSLYHELNNKNWPKDSSEMKFIGEVVRHMEYLRDNPPKRQKIPPFPGMEPYQIEVPKKKLWTEPISDRLEKIPEKERNFWIQGDNTIIADPVKFTERKFNSFSHVVIRTEEGDKMIERPWVGYDTTSGYAAEKIAEQFRREKLLKVAEQLAKAAEKLEDEKEKEYFLDVIKELRLKYHGY